MGLGDVTLQVASHLKDATAELALVWHLVFIMVIGRGLVVNKRGGAQGMRVEGLFRVSLWKNRVDWLGEGFLGILVRFFFSRVHAHVSPEVALLRERLKAVLTLVRLVAGVHPEVCLQARPGGKLLQADPALSLARAMVALPHVLS